MHKGNKRGLIFSRYYWLVVFNMQTHETFVDLQNEVWHQRLHSERGHRRMHAKQPSSGVQTQETFVDSGTHEIFVDSRTQETFVDLQAKGRQPSFGVQTQETFVDLHKELSNEHTDVLEPEPLKEDPFPPKLSEPDLNRNGRATTEKPPAARRSTWSDLVVTPSGTFRAVTFRCFKYPWLMDTATKSL